MQFPCTYSIDIVVVFAKDYFVDRFIFEHLSIFT